MLEVTINEQDASSVIGRGTFATVHRVDATVAIKAIPFSAKDKIPRSTFANERAVFWRLAQDENRCSAIVRHLNAYVRGNKGFIVMEFAAGKCLDRIESALGRRNVARQLFEALAYLHDNKIAHRDIKPENILYHPETFAVKIIDFGFACIDADSVADRVGTPYYMAPELLLSDTAPYDPYKVDIWAAGLMVHYMHAGKPALYTARTMGDLRSELGAFNPLLYTNDLDSAGMQALFLLAVHTAPALRRDARVLAKRPL